MLRKNGENHGVNTSFQVNQRHFGFDLYQHLAHVALFCNMAAVAQHWSRMLQATSGRARGASPRAAWTVSAARMGCRPTSRGSWRRKLRVVIIPRGVTARPSRHPAADVVTVPSADFLTAFRDLLADMGQSRHMKGGIITRCSWARQSLYPVNNLTACRPLMHDLTLPISVGTMNWLRTLKKLLFCDRSFELPCVNNETPHVDKDRCAGCCEQTSRAEAHSSDHHHSAV